MATYETVGRYKSSTQIIPTSRSEVLYVYHATHIEFALDMIKDIKLDSDGRWRCQVEFEILPSRKRHNKRLSGGKHLLFFGCELGKGWTKGESRYGNVMFKFLLRDLLKAFARKSSVQPEDLKFYAMGTTVYRKEHSQKVLVMSPTCLVVEEGIFPLLPRIGEFTDEFIPLTRDEKGTWLQINSVGMDQMEFAFLFDKKPCDAPDFATLQLSGMMEFYSHDDICVPIISRSSKTPMHCKVRKRGHSYRTSERAGLIDAQAEFAAAVICERKFHLKILHDTYRALLEDRLEKIRQRYPNGVDDVRYARMREFPKFHYTFRYYEEGSPESEDGTRTALEEINGADEMAVNE